MPFALPDVGAPTVPTPSGLTTEHGIIGIGDAADHVTGSATHRLDVADRPGVERIEVMSTIGSGRYLLTDGAIASVGASNDDC